MDFFSRIWQNGIFSLPYFGFLGDFIPCGKVSWIFFQYCKIWFRRVMTYIWFSFGNRYLIIQGFCSKKISKKCFEGPEILTSWNWSGKSIYSVLFTGPPKYQIWCVSESQSLFCVINTWPKTTPKLFDRKIVSLKKVGRRALWPDSRLFLTPFFTPKLLLYYRPIFYANNFVFLHKVF